MQILGYTKFKEMIRLSAKAIPTPETEHEKWTNVTSTEQSYLANVYPGDTQAIGIIFEIKSGNMEYFNLGANPILGQS